MVSFARFVNNLFLWVYTMETPFLLTNVELNWIFRLKKRRFWNAVEGLAQRARLAKQGSSA